MKRATFWNGSTCYGAIECSNNKLLNQVASAEKHNLQQYYKINISIKFRKVAIDNATQPAY